MSQDRYNTNRHLTSNKGVAPCNHCMRQRMFRELLFVEITREHGTCFLADFRCTSCGWLLNHGFVIPLDEAINIMVPDFDHCPIASPEATEHWENVAEGVNPKALNQQEYDGEIYHQNPWPKGHPFNKKGPDLPFGNK